MIVQNTRAQNFAVVRQTGAKMASWTDAYKKWDAFEDSDEDETTINDELVVTPHAPRRRPRHLAADVFLRGPILDAAPAVPCVWGRQGLRGHAAQGGAGAGLVGLSQRVRGRQGRAPSVHRGALRQQARFARAPLPKDWTPEWPKGRRGPCRVDGGHSRDVAEVADGCPAMIFRKGAR